MNKFEAIVGFVVMAAWIGIACWCVAGIVDHMIDRWGPW